MVLTMFNKDKVLYMVAYGYAVVCHNNIVLCDDGTHLLEFEAPNNKGMDALVNLEGEAPNNLQVILLITLEMMPMGPTPIATNVQVPLGIRHSFQKSKMATSIMDNEMLAPPKKI
jgi:hypothetical protein